jgi:hypothetical protein
MTSVIDKYVVFNDEFHVAVCTTCQSGIAGDVCRHFARNHKETWKQHSKQLKARVKEWKLAKEEDVRAAYPDAFEVRDPVPRITVHNGWCCDEEECLELSTDDVTMSQHCRVAHRWKAHHRKMWSACQLQSLFPRPHLRHRMPCSYSADNQVFYGGSGRVIVSKKRTRHWGTRPPH